MWGNGDQLGIQHRQGPGRRSGAGQLCRAAAACASSAKHHQPQTRAGGSAGRPWWPDTNHWGSEARSLPSTLLSPR